MMKYPRVPLPKTIELIGKEQILQINHCRNPHCENYGKPARHKRGKPGPSRDRDMEYKLHSTSKGSTPSIRCKSCLDNPPIRSNEGIASEIERLIAAGRLRKAAENHRLREFRVRQSSPANCLQQVPISKARPHGRLQRTGIPMQVMRPQDADVGPGSAWR